MSYKPQKVLISSALEANSSAMSKLVPRHLYSYTSSTFLPWIVLTATAVSSLCLLKSVATISKGRRTKY